jgi:uncharacterized protein (TIGR00290 family)
MCAQPIIVMSSGGKDSLFMLERLRADSEWEVCALVTTVNETNGRVAMHGTSETLVRAQASSLGLPIDLVGLPENCDNQVYEQRLAQAMNKYRQQGIGHVACGDLFLEDIRQWREGLFERLGWEPIFPIWGEPTDRLACRMVEDGWQATLTCVDTEKLPESMLGRCFDSSLLDEMPEGVDPCGENGEFHTFVHGGPGFSLPIGVSPGRVVRVHERFAMLDLLRSGS